MKHFFSESGMAFYARQAFSLGCTPDELARTIGKGFTYTDIPSLGKKIPSAVGITLFRELNKLGFQHKLELDVLEQRFSSSSFYKTYILHNSDFNSFFLALRKIVAYNDSAVKLELVQSKNYICIHYSYEDARAEFYSTQGVALSLYILLMEYLKHADTGDVEVFFKSDSIPDLNNFKKKGTKRVNFNGKADFIQIPIELTREGNNKVNQSVKEYFEAHFDSLYKENTSDFFMERLNSFIRFNGDIDIASYDMDALSKKLNMSRSTFYRNLQQRGLTFKRVLEEKRKKVAFIMIRDTQISLNEISDRLGYANLSAFSRAFMRWYNVSPSSIRKKP